MYAVVAVFKNGRFDLIGFANTNDEVESMIDRYITRHGAEYLGGNGVHFNVELAA